MRTKLFKNPTVLCLNKERARHLMSGSRLPCVFFDHRACVLAPLEALILAWGNFTGFESNREFDRSRSSFGQNRRSIRSSGYGFGLARKRHARTNPSSSVWFGIDVDRAVHQVDSFGHID